MYSTFKFSEIFVHCTIPLTYNVVAYCRSCCFPTLYQREPARENTLIFIPRGKAAILAICSLQAVESHSRFFPFRRIFQYSVIHFYHTDFTIKNGRVGEPNMAQPFLAWGFGCEMRVANLTTKTWHFLIFSKNQNPNCPTKSTYCTSQHTPLNERRIEKTTIHYKSPPPFVNTK